MGRRKIGKEYKKPSDYSYDYPEQRKLSNKLRKGDRQIIADKTGYSFEMIVKMCKGKRKMTENVIVIIKQLTLINKQINSIRARKSRGRAVGSSVVS